jgi:hypothetical protein
MKVKEETENLLSKRYSVLPYIIDFKIHGFNLPFFYPKGSKAFALKADVDCDEWFKRFAHEVISRVGKEFFPVCRLSDGEFLFLFGDQPPYGVMSLKDRVKYWILFVKNRFFENTFHAFTGRLYSSGRYSAKERRLAHDDYSANLKFISEKGALAMHLSFNINIPFQEKYFPMLKKWLLHSGIELNAANYYQFYFVYALFASSYKSQILSTRKVLVVHGATDAKRNAIISGLLREGVSEVYWCGISAERSLFDEIDLNGFAGLVDLCLVGAGIGKVNIFRQLERLRVPCIDAGYFFEVWANPEAKWHRAYCFNELEYLENYTGKSLLT